MLPKINVYLIQPVEITKRSHTLRAFGFFDVLKEPDDVSSADICRTKTAHVLVCQVYCFLNEGTPINAVQKPWNLSYRIASLTGKILPPPTLRRCTIMRFATHLRTPQLELLLLSCAGSSAFHIQSCRKFCIVTSPTAPHFRGCFQVIRAMVKRIHPSTG